MRGDLRIKIRPGLQFASKYARYQLVRLLEFSHELEIVYRTYPKLRRLVGYRAWQELTDTVYQELLSLNLNPSDEKLRGQVERDFAELEDILGSTVTRDEAGLRETLSLVLKFRILHQLTHR